MIKRKQNSYYLLFIAWVWLTGCSFERDPAARQSIQFQVQSSELEEISANAFAAFLNHPCVVLRYCGEQVGCNETLPKKMVFFASSGQPPNDSGTVSFGVPLAIRRKYKFQMLGYQDAESDCSVIQNNPIQMGGTSDPFQVKPGLTKKLTLNYKTWGNFLIIRDPGKSWNSD